MPGHSWGGGWVCASATAHLASGFGTLEQIVGEMGGKQIAERIEKVVS